jgi:antirestriction protein ArdC
MSINVYEIVTNRIIEKLQEGVVPWRRPWTNRGGAVSWKTQKAYRGINQFLLPPGEYATYKQIEEVGAKVKKGEKAWIVVFWKWLEKQNKETGKAEKIPLLRYFNVFEISTQVEGMNSKQTEQVFEHEPLEVCEQVVDGYDVELRTSSGRAYYVPSLNYISVPPMQDYQHVEEYYSTLFHEMVHSTGHKSRLNRDGVNGADRVAFGDETYSKEELVAEMGATMLCGHCGIENATIDNSASYIQSWLRALKGDSRLVVMAASQAQKASDYILGVKFEKEE